MRHLAIKASFFTLLVLSQVQILSAQCNGQVVPEPSFFCDTAPILCQIECLDNFHGVLPDTLMEPQPESLCNGGQANNMSWFAFVAGSDSISLTIVPSNCTEILVDSSGTITRYSGIQVGIYKNCDFDDNDRELVCATPCSDGPVDIGSSNFEIGQIYYLFVDGCAGSVCEYDVNVNFGEQAFEMPEFTGFSNSCNINFDTDTICAGTITDITLTAFDLDVEYNWSIEPSTASYPTGIHPTNDSSTVTWQFHEPGNFQICVFANNFCDANDTLCFDVVVDTLVDEYFTDIFVCQECFPIVLGSSDTTCVIGEEGLLFPTILTENPNGDAIAGWLGFDMVMTPGIVEHIVPTACGCTYKQIVNVLSIPIKPRESVTLYRCLEDFPFDYHGENIAGPVENLFITIENAASTRCDSLVSLTVEFFGQTASVEEGNCQEGGVLLHFDLNADIPAGASVTYEWFEGSNTLADSDGIDSTMLVMASGFYSVEGEFSINGDTCMFTVGSGFIDLDNLTPDAPTFGVVGTEVCQDDMIMIFIEDEGQSVTYEWSLLPSLPFVFGMTTDTIFVDASTNLGFQYSAIAVNDCGESIEVVDVMAVQEAPTVAIDMLDQVCLDSLLTIVYSGNADLSTATFEWDFDGGIVENTADIDGPGPHAVSWTAGGTYNVSCLVTDGPCSSALLLDEVLVLSAQSAPPVTCTSLAGGVSYTIENLPAGISYFYSVVSGTFTSEEVVDDIISFGGMDINAPIVIEISFVTDCGQIVQTYECMSLDCPAVDLAIQSADELQICDDDAIAIVTLSPTLAGVVTNEGVWTSANISANGEVVVRDVGVGTHTFVYELEQGGCIYKDSIVLDVFDVPELQATVISDPCDPAILGTVELMATTLGGVYAFDGSTTNDGMYTDVIAGTYTAMYVSADGCPVEIPVVVEATVGQTVVINGNLNSPEGSEQSYNFTASTTDVVDIVWILNQDILCQGVACDVVSFVPQAGDLLSVILTYGEACEVTHEVIIETFRPTTLFFPTAFSPNGDNNNDTFYPITNNPNLNIARMMIYDRWGNCVHSEVNVIMGEETAYWNGTMNGTPVANGVYVYIVEYLDDNGDAQSIMGDVTIMR